MQYPSVLIVYAPQVNRGVEGLTEIGLLIAFLCEADDVSISACAAGFTVRSGQMVLDVFICNEAILAESDQRMFKLKAIDSGCFRSHEDTLVLATVWSSTTDSAQTVDRSPFGPCDGLPWTAQMQRFQ